MDNKEKDKDISIKKVFFKICELFLLLLIIYRACSIKLEKIEIEKNYKYFFCFSSMGKFENNYVNELVEYYKNIGVEKFIFVEFEHIWVDVNIF